jgi:hypothetical protein
MDGGRCLLVQGVHLGKLEDHKRCNGPLLRLHADVGSPATTNSRITKSFDTTTSIASSIITCSITAIG